METISFKSNEFNLSQINGDIKYPSKIIEKMIFAIKSIHRHVDIECLNGTYVLTHGNKSIHVSALQFALSDCKSIELFKEFIRCDFDKAIVCNVSLYEDCKPVSGIEKSIAIVYNTNEENKALFMFGTKAASYIREYSKTIKLFFADNDEMVGIIADRLPKDSIINKSKIGLNGIVHLNEYDVKIAYSKGLLTAIIPHKYTATDLMYGTRFADYTRTESISTQDDARSFDWRSLWDDLYSNRNGKCIYSGSLGS